MASSSRAGANQVNRLALDEKTFRRQSSTPEEGDEWDPPPLVAEYRLVRKLGHGGMGQVFLAEDTLLERPVAIKFIRHANPPVEAQVQFLVEARATARLQHPNLVSTYRIGYVEGHPYIVCEFIAGDSLQALELPLPWKQVLEIATGLAQGLAAAHRRGVLHRDIKPANVIVTEEGVPKLVDFGLAKLLGNGESFDAQKERSTKARRGSQRPASGDSGAKGTPHYIAPELWAGSHASPRSDVYSLGALAYVLASGAPPYGEMPMNELAASFSMKQLPLPVPILKVAPLLNPHFAAIVDRCIDPSPAKRFQSADELLDALQQLVPNTQRGPIPDGNPYRGLEAFQPEHSALFFGRESEIRQLLDRLRIDPFLLIAGDSGVGKSSLCRAGLLPALMRGALGFEGRVWSTATVVPGKRPLTALLAALAQALNVEEGALARGSGPQGVGVGPAALGLLGNTRGVVLLIDQMEELCTLADPREAQAFAETLLELCARNPSVRVIGSVRGDFVARVALLPGLGDLIARSMYVLPPLSRDGMREAIVGPARVKGYRFESDEFVDTLISSADKSDAALPLLQFALAELWEARNPNSQIIPASALAELGGVSGALAKHADSVVSSLSPNQQKAAQHILGQLVTLEHTRARKTHRELNGDRSDVQAALKALVNGRLLVARQSDGKEAAYEVAHEALLAGWATLKLWLEQESENRSNLERLDVAVNEWTRLGRTRHELWSARQLASVVSLDGEYFSATQTAFIQASQANVQRQKKLKRAYAAAAVICVGVAALGAQRVYQYSQGQACRGGEVMFEGVWDADKKAMIEAAFLATRQPFARESWRGASKAIDSYVQQWVAMRGEACVATRQRKEQSEEVLSLRMACLDRRLMGVKALAGLYAHADAQVVEKAVGAAQSLDSIHQCADIRALKAVVPPPKDAATAAEVTATRTMVVEAKALIDSGKYEEGQRVAREAVSKAKAIGYRPLEAEALEGLGEGLMDSNPREAELIFEQSIWSAQSVADDRLLSLAALKQAFVVGYLQHKPAEGKRWGMLSLATSQKIGGDPAREAETFVNLGTIQLDEANYEEALIDFEKARALFSSIYGEDDEHAARVHNNKFIALNALGRDREAFVEIDRAVSLMTVALGAQHPEALVSTILLSVAHRELEEFGKAIEIGDRALNAFERNSQGQYFAAAAQELGVTYRRNSDHEVALKLLERARVAYTALLGIDDSNVGLVESQIADVYEDQGKYAQSLEMQKRAYEKILKSLGPQHHLLVEPLSGIARCQLKLNLNRDAVSNFQAAIEIRETKPGRPQQLDALKSGLVEALAAETTQQK